MTKLFVRGLPYATTSDQLRELFTQFGNVVSADVIMDRMTGRSRGFGFVEMENDEEAQKAIQELEGSDFGGRQIGVSVARPREDRPQNDRNNGGFRRDNNFRSGGNDFRRGGRR